MESRLVIKVLCFLFLSWIGIAAALEEDGSRNVESSVVSVDISKLGAPEYLSPHLIELQNFVRSYLPKNLRLINIIEAYREIINGVRYDLLIKTLDSQDTEVVCHLVIKEKWEFSVIEHTNCSSYYKDNDPYISQYETRTINRHRDNSDRPLNLRDLEHQIVPKNRNGYSPPKASDAGENFEGSAENDEKLTDAAKDALAEIFGDIPDSNYIQKSPNEKIKSGKSSEEIPQYRRKRAAIEKGNTKLPYSLSSKGPFRTKSNLLAKAEYMFDKYQLKYNKNYAASELKKRFNIFRANLALIDELNRNEQGTAKYGMTEFTDMTPEEYRQRTGLIYSKSSENNVKNPTAEIPDIKLPTEFDWRKKGAVSPVKDQGSCGSCWAFSVTGNIEGLHAIKTGNLEEYSEQELLDCDTVDKACMGGLPDDAYKAIEQIGGLELESEYPYKARKNQCAFNESKVHVKISGAVDLPENNETAMAQWLVANGPISIGINANAMQFYRGGISHPWKILCRAGGIDHGVLIVGFGVKEYPKFNQILPYWIVKNSWGPRWGEQGYYRVFRGDNTCGVSSMASSAVLE